MTGPSRLTECLRVIRSKNRKALCMYVTAADPDVKTSISILHALVAGGVDVIELGYPFCDPILDGPVIRRANQRALASGGSFIQTLEIVREFRRSNQRTPIILMGYANPIFCRGVTRSIEMSKQAGVDGFIIADCPAREAERDFLRAIAAYDLHYIPLLVRETTTGDLGLHNPGVGGFVYCVPQSGPTGGAAAPIDVAAAAIRQCRAVCDLPLGVGFGIKTPEIAAVLARYADLIIVGTAVIDYFDILFNQKAGRASAENMDALVNYCSGFSQAINSAR